MFHGNYHFFDYKYNIQGYSGQDYGGIAQYVYLITSVVLLIILLIYCRNYSKEKVQKLIQKIGIFMILFYIGKTTWESIYDITTQGSFNTGLLPLDACSIIMLAAILSGFSKGKIKEYATAWISTGGIVGGLSAVYYLNALKYYPFFSFGAFYSMTWHFLMTFLGLLVIITQFVEIQYQTIIKGFLFHLVFSLFVIPIDFLFDLDFMMYKSLGSIPIFEEIASQFTANGFQFLNPIMMLLLYFITFHIAFILPLILKKKRVD